MLLKECRYLTITDTHDLRFKNWSRAYEWPYCLTQLAADPTLLTVHNSACGDSELHRQFSQALDALPGKTIFNSDINCTEANAEFSNFFEYNLLTPCQQRFDCSLCISTLEDFGSESAAQLAINNLAASSRRVIITCDDPGFNPKWLEGMFQVPPLDKANRLTGHNSAFHEPDSGHLSILLIDFSLDIQQE